MDKFTSKHLAFLIMGASIVSLKTYPTVFIRNGGRDSWVASIIATGLFLAYLLFILYASKKLNCFNLYEIYTKAVGKPLGTVFIWLFWLTLFMTLIESASVEANSMHTNMLLETPSWFFLLFFVFPAAYTVSRDKVSILSVTMIGLVLICMAGINLSILTAKYKRYDLMFPIFENGVTSGFFIAIIEILGLYATASIVLPYLSDIKDNKKLIKHALIGMLIVAQMEIIAISGVISTFEVEYLNTMAYPKLLQTQLVQYARFMESGELYVMLQILGGWYIKYIVAFYALLRVLVWLKLHSKTNIAVITILVFFISYMISDNLFILFRFLNIYVYFCIFNFFLIPTVMTMICYMKNTAKTQKSQEANLS